MMTASVLLLLIAVSWLCPASGQLPAASLPLVSVSREHRRVQVARGGRVDLRPALHFHLEFLGQGVNCRLTNVLSNGSACGNVEQNVFDCKNYTGTILYQHFGCLHTRDLVTFLVSTSPSDYSPHSVGSTLTPGQVSVVSVEVSVGPPDNSITIPTVEVRHRTYAQSNYLKMAIVFPPSAMGEYHYEIVRRSPVLSLPSAGALTGPVNQPLPSGYVHNTPFTYHPDSEVTHPYTDYLLMKLYLHNSTSYTVYSVLPFATTQGEKTKRKVVQLHSDNMIIHQAMNTPISASDFSSFNLSLNLASHGSSEEHGLLRPNPLPLVYYDFPILIGGSFRSLYSTSSNISYTIFTSHELAAGHVAFYPTDHLSSTEPVLYRYRVANRAGVLIARGEINVLVREREWEKAPQRKNVPLTVLEGGMAAINNLTMDFYTTHSCGAQATLRILRQPQHGELVYENGTRIENEEILFWVMRNTTLVRYRHLGGEELGDVIYWGRRCPTGSERVVFMSVLISAVDDTPPSLVIRSALRTYGDWATPLSPSSLQVRDPDSARADIRFTVQHLGGTLLKTFQPVSEFNSSSVLYPLISLEDFTSIVSTGLYEELNFDLTDVEQQRIWYFPSGGLDQDRIEFTVTDGSNQSPHITTQYVTVSQAPSHALRISTPIQYPYVLKNKPLPLLEEGHMFLTSHFLYSQAPPSTPENVRYLVTTPPEHGRLCSLSYTSHCAESLSAFTQQDINYHKVIYRPNTKKLKPDHFQFVVTVQGVHHVNATTHTFNWTTVSDHVVVSERPFWLNSGTRKRIAPKYFRPFISLLQAGAVSFEVLDEPKYGHLLLGNGTHFYSSRPSVFTFDDVLSRSLWYNHTQRSNPASCSDSLLFKATSPHQTVHGRLMILFRRNKDEELTVVFHPRTIQGLTHFSFSSKDFAVSSPFCPEFVTFIVDQVPGEGQLTLKDSVHKTERQLMSGSTFTAKDVQLGALSYRFSLEHVPQSNLSDMFALNVSDPLESWPGPESLRNNPYLGHFLVIIVPSINEEYRLEVNFSSGHSLTWLPSRNSYGYAFSSSDIDLLNSTLQPSEVVVQVESGLTLGNLARGDTPVSFFTIADLQAGGVVYIKNSLILEQLYEDDVELGVYAYLPGFYQRAVLYQFVFEWAVVELDRAMRTVSELQPTLQVTIRRRGATWFESRVIVATSQDSASSELNCSTLLDNSSDTLLQGAGDFCHLRQEVVFPVGVVMQEVTIRLLDDDIAEGEEIFFVQLLEEEGLTNAILHGNVRSKVTITDMEDYNIVSMLGPPGLTDDCDHQVDVEEFTGQLVVNLTRVGRLEQEVGVVCTTEDDSATANSDYIARLSEGLGSEVMFGVNQSTAACVVEIVDDGEIEHREMFYLHLSPLPDQGLVLVNSSSATMCIFINHDDYDNPIVSFNETEVFVQESETEKKYVQFTLNRKEPNLGVTTEVKYFHLPKAEDTAVENVDFKLFTSDNCNLEGEQTGGCVSFAPGQIHAGLTVEILADTIQEGNETFHLKIEYARNGRRSDDLSLSTLKVTIIDAAAPSYIELVNTSIWILESSHINYIPVRRSGHLLSTTEFRCRFKGNNATGSTVTSSSTDFIVTKIPGMVTFNPGDELENCVLIVTDDMRYEGLESLVLILELVEEQPGVMLRANRDRAVIHISDHEDVPVVEFPSTRSEIAEPLSNSSLDLSLLTLEVRRRGDISVASTVSYTTVDVTARGGADYEPVSGVLQFEEGSNVAEIAIRALANHKREEDTEFLVQLSLPPITTDQPTTIGENSTMRVLVRNLPLLGPYFPALPQLDNVRSYGERLHTAGLYYDLPLACITACDVTYNSTEDVSSCERLGVANQRTIYTWEWSAEGAEHFHPLELGSEFIPTLSQVLQPFYLWPGLRVRCTAQAVDSTGVRGYSRTSLPVELTRERYGCYQHSEGQLQATLSTYDSFVAADEDLVFVEITVPAVRNQIPLLSLSTSPLSHTSNNTSSPSSSPSDNTSSPSCSNTHQILGYSLLGRSVQSDTAQLNFDLLYSHLNWSSCQWRFTGWFPVHTLVESCGGHRPTPGVLNITAINTYQEFGGEGVITHEPNQTSTSISGTNSTTPFLPPPLHILSQTGEQFPYLYPLSMSHEEGGDGLRIFVYLVTQPDLLLNTSNQQSLQLLYMSTARTEQVWQLQVETASQPLSMSFSQHGEGSCAECEQGYVFQLPLEIGETQVPKLLLNVTAILQHETLYTGDRVNLTVKLDSKQRLQGGESLQVKEIHLCEHTGGCFIRIKGAGGSSDRFDLQEQLNNPGSITLDFSTEAIVASQWLLQLRLGLSSSALYETETNLPLTLLSPPTPQVTATNLLEASEPPQPLYIVIGLLAAIIFSLVVLGLVVVVLVCVNHGKTKFYQKTSILRNRNGSGKEVREKLNSVHSKGQGNSYESPSSMTRTNSTIGFPTQEHRLKRSGKPTTKLTRAWSRAKPAPVKCLQRSQSLPNVVPSPLDPGRALPPFLTHEPAVVRKINRHGVRVHFKRVNVESSVLNMWNTQQLKRNKELANLHIVQDLAIRYKNYGVNEIEPGHVVVRSRGSGHGAGPYAKYVVTTLAASAKTPEPGAKPVTKL